MNIKNRINFKTDAHENQSVLILHKNRMKHCFNLNRKGEEHKRSHRSKHKSYVGREVSENNVLGSQNLQKLFKCLSHKLPSHPT